MNPKPKVIIKINYQPGLPADGVIVISPEIYSICVDEGLYNHMATNGGYFEKSLSSALDWDSMYIPNYGGDR